MKNKSKFVPQCGDRYFFIDAGGTIKNYAYCDDNVDEWILKHHHVFRSYDECKEYKHYLEVLDEYTFKPDWDDRTQGKWHPYFDHDEKRICLKLARYFQYQGKCFESFDKGIGFIKKVGENAVKRFMFDYWE